MSDSSATQVIDLTVIEERDAIHRLKGMLSGEAQNIAFAIGAFCLDLASAGVEAQKFGVNFCDGRFSITFQLNAGAVAQSLPNARLEQVRSLFATIKATLPAPVQPYDVELYCPKREDSPVTVKRARRF